MRSTSSPLSRTWLYRAIGETSSSVASARIVKAGRPFSSTRRVAGYHREPGVPAHPSLSSTARPDSARRGGRLTRAWTRNTRIPTGGIAPTGARLLGNDQLEVITTYDG